MIKAIFLFFILFTFTSIASGYTVRTTGESQLVKWETSIVTIYLDSSLEIIGSANEVYPSVEDAFLSWTYEADLDLEFDFIYEDCTNLLSTNCISAYDGSKGNAGGNTEISYNIETGEILEGDIVFYKDAGEWGFRPDAEKIDFNSVALHETGHFLGLTHSAVEAATMYESLNTSDISYAQLHNDDIWGAEALYDSSAMIPQTTCTMAPATTSTQSFISIIISLFF